MENNKWDFFISYNHNDDNIVEEIVKIIENKNAKCWKYTKDNYAEFEDAIVNGIKGSKKFIIFLSKNSANSEHIWREVDIAFDEKKLRGISDKDYIQIYIIDDINLSDYSRMYYKLSGGIDRKKVIDKTPNQIADMIIERNQKILIDNNYDSGDSQVDSTYNDNFNEYEKERLKLQSEISYDVDKNVYEKVFSKYDKLKILDVGCAEGRQIYDRLNNIEDFLVIGIDINDELVKKAKEQYGNRNGKFYTLDLNDKNFTNEILNIMSENNIESFDVVNISMLFTHLKCEEISNFLHKLHKLINKDSTIIINEYENSLSWVYPDNNNNFDKIFSIISDDSDTGNGNVGKMIYKLLVDTSYSRINLEIAGYPYLNRDVTYRDNVFEMEFGFLVDDMRKLCEKYPDDEKYKNNLAWLNENIDKVKCEFIKPDFLYFSGYIVYTAQK